MVYGVGTDIVAISRIEHSLDKYGDKFAEKILAKSELEQFQKKNSLLAKSAFLAKRFAAKEATAKALGTGFRDGLCLTHIVVTNNSYGRPELEFYGRAAELKKELGISYSHLSLSDEKKYAIAFVTLERKD